jgi:hypothetical protein
MTSSKSQLPPPPIFGVSGDERVARNGIISLVDIFDDFLFSGDRNSANSGQAVNYHSQDKILADPDDEGDYDSNDDDLDDSEDGKRRKRNRVLQRNMTEEQKIERRLGFCFSIGNRLLHRAYLTGAGL